MILSVSRRSDVPAFYSQWFINRLRAGFLMIRNPINPRMVRKIEFSLHQDSLEGVVFWSKNPKPIFRYLPELAGIPFYFLFTVTPYGSDLETQLPPKAELLETFRELAGEIGKERVIWRYDPVILTPVMDEDWHKRRFEELARSLRGSTERCFFSFVVIYRKRQLALQGISVREAEYEERERLAIFFRNVASANGIVVSSCAEPRDYFHLGVTQGKCIDEELFKRLSGRNLTGRKDPGQRKECRCVASIDVGAYDSCPHGCLYCYANTNRLRAQHVLERHQPDSPLLSGNLSPSDIITTYCFTSTGGAVQEPGVYNKQKTLFPVKQEIKKSE